jgi:hypothetical protein
MSMQAVFLLSHLPGPFASWDRDYCLSLIGGKPNCRKTEKTGDNQNEVRFEGIFQHLKCRLLSALLRSGGFETRPPMAKGSPLYSWIFILSFFSEPSEPTSPLFSLILE